MADHARQWGQYMTPTNVAAFVTRMAHIHLDSTILETSAGIGRFCKALTDAGYTNIIAFEKDMTLNNISSVSIRYEDFLDIRDIPTVDAIIGNPPYVRWRNIDSAYRDHLLRGKWRDWCSSLPDLMFLFLAASVYALKPGGTLTLITPITWFHTRNATAVRNFMLRHGAMKWIVSFRETRLFADADAFFVVWQYQKGSPAHPIHTVTVCQDVQITDKVLQAIITIIERPDETPPPYLTSRFIEPFANANAWHIDETDEATNAEAACYVNDPIVPCQTRTGKKVQVRLSTLLSEYHLSDLQINPARCDALTCDNNVYYAVRNRTLFDTTRIPRKYSQLGDVMTIRAGMQSGLDRVFMLTEEDRCIIGDVPCILPFYKACDLDRYRPSRQSYGLYPNILTITDEQILRDKYPTVYDHLLPYKNELQNRYADASCPWWNWTYPRNYAIMHASLDKLLLPTLDRVDAREYIRASLVTQPAYLSVDVVFMVKQAWVREDIRYILALLNSDVAFTWLRQKGGQRGGVMTCTENHISRIPIRLIDWKNGDEVNTHNDIVTLVSNCTTLGYHGEKHAQINEMVGQLYGIDI